MRKKRGWSLDLASKETGVSKAMLGQIERGESSPSIATLWKIVSGFDVSFSSFVGGVKTLQSNLVHHSKHWEKMHPDDEKIRIIPIFEYDEDLGFEVFIVELLPGYESLSLPHQKGVVEHIIVSSGEIEVLIDGAWHSVTKNEGTYFNADKPHGYRNLSNITATFHNMIHYKARGI